MGSPVISLEEYRKLPADRGVSGSEAVYWAVYWDVDRAVYWAVYRNVYRNVSETFERGFRK